MKDAESPLITYFPRGRRLVSTPDLLLLAILGCLFAWIAARASSLPQYDWNWSLALDFLIVRDSAGRWEPGALLRGLLVTIRVGSWTILFSLCFGSMLGIAVALGRPWTRFAVHVCVNILRNTPPLVLLFCVYFFSGNILPVAAINEFVASLPPFLSSAVALLFAPPTEMDRMLAAVLALGLYQGAYITEIIRSGVEAVPRGQWDAAQALGFSRICTLALVILPQTARIIVPPLTGQVVTTFKDSALGSLISLPDLTFQSLETMAVSQLTFEIWIAAAVLYLLLGLLCSLCGDLLERKYASFKY